MPDSHSPTFAEMIFSGRFVKVAAEVTPAAFPLDPTCFTLEGLQVIGFTTRITTVDQANLDLVRRQLIPAGAERFLAYLSSVATACERYALVALGTLGRDRLGRPCFLRAIETQEGRILDTKSLDEPFETFERTLIVHTS
jgi:hypothetical protein